jgi:hypothetical protein
VIDSVAAAILLGGGFGIVMQRSAIADMAVWDACARHAGVDAPEQDVRRGLALIGGLALMCSGVLRLVG